MLRCLARLEAVLDFGDDAALGESEAAAAAADAAALAAELEAHAAAYARARLAREGARVAIAGRPNGGKSSLLNRLAGREAAIVAPTAGTTRDVVEAPLALAGHGVVVAGEPILPLSANFSTPSRCMRTDTPYPQRKNDNKNADSAGLRAADCPIEAQGVARALREARRAGAVLWVVDAHEAVAATGGGGGGGANSRQPPPDAWLRDALAEAAAALSGGGPGGDEDNGDGVGNGSERRPPPRLMFVLNKADLVAADDLRAAVDAGRELLAATAAAANSADADAAALAAAARVLEPVSCATGAGLDALVAALERCVRDELLAAEGGGGGGALLPPPLVTRLRHRDLVAEAATHLQRASELALGGEGSGGGGAPALELAAEEVRAAEAALCALTGEPGRADVEGMLDRLFAEFCVGK